MEPGLLIDRNLNIGIVHLEADLPLDAFIRDVRRAIRRARRLALEGLVVVMSEVKGFPPPDTTSRKDMVMEWAESAHDDFMTRLAHAAIAARIRLAIAVPDDYIDRERIGIKIAAMQGLAATIVCTEKEAIDWMSATKPRP